ncbi:hypothetical protein FHE72_20375 [Rossellomorea vietnamensis]|uniref:Treble clef zinc finger domain-containing protein n=1 Tax=Rossellomorea vietnamensis TaxID=218284 RepID=A0A6I6UM98_9BACI|nr:zinc-ribbon domain-containing protein [Rossellomorea vietnamensis]QHE63098.1 hypothetical protein FHE72_20375 [Rossellomorea vietnamensis]
MKIKKSLFEVRADLNQFYHLEDNGFIDMKDISYGSKRIIYFRCDYCGNSQGENEAKSANSYTKLNKNKDGFHKGFECTYCNSLAVKYPGISSDWDYEMNIGTPHDYKRGSRYKAYWICEQGHKWQTSINTRTTNQTSCPECVSSAGEKAIGEILKEMDIKYFAEYPVGIAGSVRRFDFYLPNYKVFIEVHGKQHFQHGFTRTLDEQQEIDRHKKYYAENHGRYIMVDYREHNPEMAVKRFLEEWRKIVV